MLSVLSLFILGTLAQDITTTSSSPIRESHNCAKALRVLVVDPVSSGQLIPQHARATGVDISYIHGCSPD